QPAVVNFAAQKGAVELRQVPVPEIGPEDVLLEVQAVGVCGSDLHMWQFCQSWPVNYPCVLGHEFGGVIRKLGERVTVGLERDRGRLEIARQEYGCTPLTDGASAKQWANEVDGLGADGAVDAAGVSATLKAAMEIVRPGGWISKVGWGPQPLNFSLDP